jgi:hypothetical protein
MSKYYLILFMKKVIFGCVIGFSLTAIVAFKAANYEPKKATAEVEQMQGLLVFIHSKPVVEFDYLGSFTPNVVPSTNAKPIINHMIKKGKEKFPTADGIIFTDDQLGKVDLIKFK